MSYIIEKKEKGNIYLYEVTNYWDSDKQQPRQKRRYLGKKDPKTGEIIQKNERIPRLSKDYGHIYLLQEIAKQCGLTQTLKNSFPDDFSVLLTIAIFEISEATPLYLFPYWAESSFLKLVTILNSKEISTFLAKIGDMEIYRLDFMKNWIKTQKNANTLYFDITSLSSYIEELEYIEWGYNRDDEKLPQINLGIVYSENTNMPLCYKIYPGSIPDVSTLKNLLKYLEFFELKDILLTLDRGFYSAHNLVSMEDMSVNFKFIIPLPRSNKLFSNLLNEKKKQLSDFKNAFLFKEEILFHTQGFVQIKNKRFKAHLYLNQQKGNEKTSRFLKKIFELEQSVQEQNFHSKKEVTEYLKNTSKFFQISFKENILQITRKTRIISNHVASFGLVVMLTNQFQLERETILKLYRKKDYIEKIFDTLKNEFDGKRLRSHSKETVEGRLFTKFIALILYSSIENTMREQDLFKQYSVKEIMYELKKIKVVEMCDGKFHLTEISKRQKDIFKAFNVDIPTI